MGAPLSPPQAPDSICRGRGERGAGAGASRRAGNGRPMPHGILLELGAACLTPSQEALVAVSRRKATSRGQGGGVAWTRGREEETERRRPAEARRGTRGGQEEKDGLQAALGETSPADLGVLTKLKPDGTHRFAYRLFFLSFRIIS